MTNERAIELLNRISDSQFDGPHGDERREALEMAVRVLEGDGDTISRQQAIEAFEPTHYKDWYTPTIIETLETLPFVRPEVLACGNGELVQESGGLVQDLVKDCISRQQAIDALDKHIDTFDAIDKNYLCGLRTAMSILKEMPSAQPERKKGKWISEVKGKKAIIDEYGNVTCSAHCSECGDWLTGSDEYACRGRFCPNCGARME